MTCDACDRAEVNPYTGRFNATCDGCAARALALSPDFHESRMQHSRTERYEQALTTFFAGREEVGHSLAMRWHRKLREARQNSEMPWGK